MPANAYYRAEGLKYPLATKIEVGLDVAQKVVSELCTEFGIPDVAVRLTTRRTRFSVYCPPRMQDPILGKVVNPRHIPYTKGNSNQIDMRPSMMNWRFIGHELAHALHTFDYDRRFKASARALRKERWHGEEHEHWMEVVMKALESRGLLAVAQKISIDWHEPVIFGAPVILPSVISSAGNIFSKGVDVVDPIPYKSVATAAPQPVVPPESIMTAMKTVKMSKAKMVVQAAVKKTFAGLAQRLTCPKCKKSRAKEDFGVRVMGKDAEGNPIVRRQSYCRTCR